MLYRLTYGERMSITFAGLSDLALEFDPAS